MTVSLIIAIVLSVIYAILFILWTMSCEAYIRETDAHLRNDPPESIGVWLLMSGAIGLMVLWGYVVSQ